MNIEIADRNKWISIDWFNAKFYLFGMGADWRFPTREEIDYIHQSATELFRTISNDPVKHHIVWLGTELSDEIASAYWHQYKSIEQVKKKCPCVLIPVRTKQ
jgi:hypothetical protein